jgi:hypothetical protein
MHAVIGEAKAPEVVVAKGGVEIVLEALRTHIGQEGVVVNACCWALARLALGGMFCVSSFSFVHPLCFFGGGLYDTTSCMQDGFCGALCFVPTC